MNTGTAIGFIANRWRSLAFVVLAASFFHPVNGSGTPYYNIFGFLKPNAGTGGVGTGGAGSILVRQNATTQSIPTGQDPPSVHLTFGFTPNSGNVIVVFVVTWSGTRAAVPSVTDNTGQSYSMVKDVAFSMYNKVSIFTRQVGPGQTVSDITVLGDSLPLPAVAIKPQVTAQAVEYSGLKAGPVTTGVCNSDDSNTSKSLLAGPITVSSSSLLVALASSNDNSFGSVNYTPANEWDIRMAQLNNLSRVAGNAIDRIVAPGTYSATWSAANNASWGACIVAFEGQ